MADMRLPFSIKPDTDQGASHYAKYGIGGYYSVKNEEERLGIPSKRLEEGLMIYEKSTKKYWIYSESDWSEVTIPSGETWTSFTDTVTSLSESQVTVKEAEEDLDAIYEELDVYTKDEVDTLLKSKVDQVSEYFMVTPGCVHYSSAQNINIKFYARTPEGLYPLNDYDLSSTGSTVSIEYYDDSGSKLSETTKSAFTSIGILSIPMTDFPENTRYIYVDFNCSSPTATVTRDSCIIVIVYDGLKFEDLSETQVASLKAPAIEAANLIGTEWSGYKDQIDAKLAELDKKLSS